MEEALSLAPISFRRNEFLTYLLETRVPGVHFNVDDDVGLTNISLSPQCCDLMIPEHDLQTLEGRGSDKPALKIPADGMPINSRAVEHTPSVLKYLSKLELMFVKVVLSRSWRGLNGESSTRKEENFGEPDAVVVEALSHSQCLEFLGRNGPNFLMKNLDDKERICSILLDMTENVKVLPPGNDPLPWDVLDMSQWKASLCGLMNEMKTVEGNCCASVIGNSGVYVLTKSPNSVFLRALAMEIADRCC